MIPPMPTEPSFERKGRPRAGQITLDWLPDPPNFRADLRAALGASDPAERLERLALLAQYRLGFVETIQLDRAFSQFAGEPVYGFSRVRLGFLASSTVDHLVPAIRVAGLRRRLLIDIHMGAYGQYRRELLDRGSALVRFAPQMVLLSLAAHDFITNMPVVSSASQVDDSVVRSVEELRLLWRTARETLKATVIQQTFLDVTEPLFGSYDRVVPASPARLIARVNDRLSEAAAQDGVLILDIAQASARDGTDAWFDPARWLQGKLEIAPAAAAIYGDLVGRVVAAQRGLSKKCLVLDLDNTLWGGVVGDDGIDGIVLGQGSAAGEAHLALQRYAKRLAERGVILAVCSKNDPAIAAAAFDHPEMILERSDIAAFVANWNDKVENLKTIAARLNIGIDSLVFVDDSPVERARVRQSLPMVAVPELPEDSADYVRCLALAGYFEAVGFTLDDRHRAEHYAANAEREALLGTSESMDDYLLSLGMSMMAGPFAAVDITRIAQLINKTNQFNPTTRRYTAHELTAAAAAPENITLQFRLRDRFGDNGLVSAMILRPDADRPDVLEIDSWVMSCRVFGRQLEWEAMNMAVEVGRSRGARAFCADYVPTPKNGVISELYPALGFINVTDVSSAGGATRWMLYLTEYSARRTRIGRKAP